MLNDYFTVRATFKELMERLLSYGRAVPPSKSKGLRFVIEGPLPVLDIEVLGIVEKLSWSVEAYAVSRRPSDAPLFEIGVTEAKDSCRVRLRLLDPRAQEWYDAMLDWLAPNWTSMDAQPLPAPPAQPPPLAAPHPAHGSKRGRKAAFSPEEWDRVCAAWLKAQYDTTQERFASQVGVSVSALQRALRAYRRRHGPD